MPSRQDLYATLANARQELQQAQIRVAEVEAQLLEGQPNPIDRKIRETTYHQPLDAMLSGCQMIGFDWRYRYVNDVATHHERHTREEFLGHTIMELHPGIEKTSVFAVLQRSMHERSVEHSEREVVYPEGGSAWFELLVQPVPEGIFIFSHDITERKQLELALLEREQQFSLLMEHAPAALAMLDNEMRYLLVSRRWLIDYRLSETDVIGRSHYDLFPDLPEQWKSIHQRCLAGAVESSEADPFPRADGSLDWVRWEIHPWRKIDGKIGGILILSEVITERKRAEEHIRKLHRTLGVLSDINQAIVRIRHLPSLFAKACAIAVEKGAFLGAWIGLFNPETAQIDPVAHMGISGSELEKIMNTLNTSSLLPVLRAGERLICNNLQADPLWLSLREEAVQRGWRATVALPLIVAGEIRGSFNLYAGETAFFDEQEMQLMDEMAGDIAFAITVAEQDQQRQHAEAAVKRYAQRMEILHQIDRGIINANSTAAIVEAALQHIRRLIPCQRANVGLLDVAKGEGVIFAVDYDGDTRLGQGLRIPISQDFFDGYNARHIKIIPDLRVLQETNPRFKQAVKEGLRSGLNVLLLDRDQPIGTLGLFANTPDFFTPEHQEIMIEIGSQLAIAIRQMQLSEQLAQHMATLEQKVAERTADLQAALGRVEAILNNSPDAILLVDADLTIQQTNQSFNPLFGAEADAYLGQSLRTLFHPDDVHNVSNLPQVGATRQNGNPLEVRAIRKDGTTFDAELTIGMIKGDGLVCIIRDITKRKAQERQLRYHASIQESVSDAVIATDMQFRIQSWNRTAELIYGRRAEETIGRSVSEILQTTYASAADGERILRDFFERGAWQGELIQHHRDGRLIYIHASVNLLKDETGQPIGVVSVNRDVTERKRAAEALQKSAAEIHDLYNHAPCGYHSIDQAGLIVQINDTELQWLGYTRAEVIGRLKVTALLTPDSVLLFQQTFPVLIAQGWMNDVELDMVRKDGSIMHILLNATAIYDDDGQYQKSRSTLFDITELQQAQRAIAERETRYRLLAESLRESEERFRRAIIDAPFPIMIHADNGEVLHISNVWAEISGYTQAELPTMAAWIEKAYRENSQTARTLIEQVYTLTKPRRGGEFRIQTKAGEERIWDFISAPLAAMPDGRRMVSSMAMDITERKQAEEALQTKMAEEHQFQLYLKALHEIIIELTGIDQLDTFYKRAVELGRERLGFERFAMFLYDARDHSAIGTYGTDIQGQLVDERGARFTPDPNGVMQRSFERIERFYVKAETTLYNDTVAVGYGWNAAATLWNGARNLGWFVTDNLLSQAPASKPLLDTLGLYALSVGTLLAQKQTQVALKESETLYRLLAENISDLIMRSTLTGECLYVSPSVQTLLGYTPEELIGQPTFSLTHPADQAIIWAAYASAVERNDLILPHQYRARHKAGHYTWLETVGKPLFRDDSNEILEIITSSRDITARKQAEAAVRESEARYRLLAENLADMIMTFSLDRQITYMSPSCEKLLGYLPEEVEGRSHSEFIHPEDYPHVIARTRQAVVAKEHSYTNQFRLRHKEGHYIWYEVRTRLVWERHTDHIVQFASVLRDITERKQAEDALRESEEKYRSLVETMRGGLAVFDTEFRVTFVNDRFCELFGYSSAEVIGKQPMTFVDAADIPLVQLHLKRRQDAESTSYELPLRHKDGHQIHVLLSGTPLLDQQGNYNGSLVVATDISVQKQAEATLRQALAKEKELGDLKTRFVSMASHEFRTPLATILALVETLSVYRNKLSEEQIEQRLAKIKAQIGHLKSIMEDVLMLARMQARRVEFNPLKLDLDALCRSVLDEFQSQAEIQHRLAYTVSEGIQEVLLDHKLMRQILSNLLSNAIKYSPEAKGVSIHLAYTASAVILKISDEGIGIPKADLPHLFEPFHRAANVGTISGTGLGLVIAREAVELHGGTITVESQQDVGTTFLIRIPIAAGGVQKDGEN